MFHFENFDFFTRQLKITDSLGDVYVDLSNENTMEKKFEYTRDLMKKYGMIPTTVADIKKWDNRCSTYSEVFRLEGNDFFRSRMYANAIEYYTQSLITSGPHSECYALALANRSAALYNYGYYEDCLRDIDRAIKSSFPSRLVYKLYGRAGDAHRILGHGDIAKSCYYKCLVSVDVSFMTEKNRLEYKSKIQKCIEMCVDLKPKEKLKPQKQISAKSVLYGSNEKIPALSKCLTLKCSKNMGRGVYATQDINPGDIVAIDEPYSNIFTSLSNFVCYYGSCMKISWTVIPCRKCSSVVYCNEECMQKSYNEGHQVECSILQSIRSLPGIPKTNELVLKCFSMDYSKIGLDKYCSIINYHSTTPVDLLTKGFDENGQYRSDSFFTVYSLGNDLHNLSADIMFFFNCVAVLILQYLILSGFEIPEHYLTTVGVSFVYMLNIFKANNYKVRLCSDLKMNKEVYAFVLYPSISLFNHSCDPNVKLHGFVNSNMSFLRAIQPIPKGSQVFISYGPTFQENNLKSRVNHLKKCHSFKCCCQPCLENWPVNRFIPNRLSSLNLLNPNEADKVISECRKFVEFKKTVTSDDYCYHLSYLYSFIKLLFYNVRRPFSLYEDCLSMISSAHLRDA